MLLASQKAQIAFCVKSALCLLVTFNLVGKGLLKLSGRTLKRKGSIFKKLTLKDIIILVILIMLTFTQTCPWL